MKTTFFSDLFVVGRFNVRILIGKGEPRSFDLIVDVNYS